MTNVGTGVLPAKGPGSPLDFVDARGAQPHAADRMRVVIGEDEALMREGLAHVLVHGGFEVVAEVANADDLVRRAPANRPDVVVTDIRMPPTHTDEGLRAALEIRARAPHIAIVVLSHHVQRRYASELLERCDGDAGVGYLLKQRVTDVESFCASLRRVCAGATVLDPEIAAILVARAASDGPLSHLTPRQYEVLDLMAQGLSNAAIAQQLVISEKAVVRHVSHIYEQLELGADPNSHRRVQAVLRHLSR
jgi:DNA-binding NarL/FixJ family response regulator